jgi:hypothetical protein
MERTRYVLAAAGSTVVRVRTAAAVAASRGAAVRLAAQTVMTAPYKQAERQAVAHHGSCASALAAAVAGGCGLAMAARL